jgi:hypothetical protein
MTDPRFPPVLSRLPAAARHVPQRRPRSGAKFVTKRMERQNGNAAQLRLFHFRNNHQCLRLVGE